MNLFSDCPSKEKKLPQITTITPWIKKSFPLAIVIAIIGIVIYFMKKDIRESDIKVNEFIQTARDKIHDQKMNALEKMYSKQEEDTWISLDAGIKSIIREKPNQPSTFLMLFASDEGAKTAKCLAEDVSKIATEYLMEVRQTPIIIRGETLNSSFYKDDPGQVLIQVKDPVMNHGALIVTDLHKIPPTVAKSFHFICDKYTPLVEKAVLFFTLKMDSLPSTKDKLRAVKNKMTDLWAEEMNDSALSPLIVRMTSYILNISPDNKCSLIN